MRKVHPYKVQIAKKSFILNTNMLATIAFLAITQSKQISIYDSFAMAFGPNQDVMKAGKEALAEHPWKPEYRQDAWKAFQQSPMHSKLKTDFDSTTIHTADRTAPFKYRIVGTPKPGETMPLVIALHGGGSGPKEMNDSQWEGMFTSYYKDQPEFAPYVYCALRAPNDEWNGFYDDSIAQVMERLILAFSIFGNVDPNRVVTTGASHGGYGNFVIATKIPHRFSAANASASAPTDGETQGENLRNLYFTWVNGATDTAFGRADRVQAFAKKWAEWKEEYGGFNGGMTFLENTGHFVPDRDKVAELLKQDRNLTPDRLIWNQTDEKVKTHYYLVDPAPKSGRRITLQLEGKTFIILCKDAEKLVLYPPADIALKDMVVIWGKSSTSFHLKPSCLNYAESLALYGDPNLASPYKIEVDNNDLNN
jgi:hypothetical protein